MIESLNWVKQRFYCSIGDVFEQLRTQVRSDVEERERLRPKQDDHYAFKFSATDRSFTAMLDGHKIHKTVEFPLEQRAISVSSDGNLILSAKTTLSNDGRCVLLIKNVEYENWQVRKMALDDLFFSEMAPPDLLERLGARPALKSLLPCHGLPKLA